MTQIKIFLGILFFLGGAANSGFGETLFQEEGEESEVVDVEATDSERRGLVHETDFSPRYLIAATEVIGLNTFLWGVNFLMNAHFSYISGGTVKYNLNPHSWEWDDDVFVTNGFMHAYQGSFYHSTARGNNIGFWGSAIYTYGGSLMWERFMETNYPSINDMIVTSLGGVAIGEATFRLGSSVILSEEVGIKRYLSEWGFAFISHGGSLARFVNTQYYHPYIKKYNPNITLQFMYGSVVRGEIDSFETGTLTSKSPTLFGIDVRFDLNYRNLEKGAIKEPFDYYNMSWGMSFIPQIHNEEKIDLNSKNFRLNQYGVEGFLFVEGLIFGKSPGWGNPEWDTLGLFLNYEYISNSLFSLTVTDLGVGYIVEKNISKTLSFEGRSYVNPLIFAMSGFFDTTLLKGDEHYEGNGYTYFFGQQIKLDWRIVIDKTHSIDLFSSTYFLYTIPKALRMPDEHGPRGVEVIGLQSIGYTIKPFLQNVSFSFGTRFQQKYMGYRDYPGLLLVSWEPYLGVKHSF